MTADEIADVLERAADALAIHGRCCVSPRNSIGQMCPLGAIYYAEHGHLSDLGLEAYDDSQVTDALAAYLFQHDRVTLNKSAVGAVWMWNDLSNETDEQIIDTLKMCASDVRSATA